MSDMSEKHKRRLNFFAMGMALVMSACSSAYYATWETFGKHKRDLLSDNVEAARDEQKEAKQEFKDALTRLKELQDFDGGELETLYEALNNDYEACVERADDVRDRIKKIDSIAEDLFAEWEHEITLISNEKFKRDSKKKLGVTRKKYTALHSSMVKAERSMDSVIVSFRDHVLYLKHNLNAQAVAGLDAEVIDIEKDVSRLIADMQVSIDKADAFITSLN